MPTGVYERRDLDDYMVLCRSHHTRYDGTAGSRKIHCAQGHPFDETNTIRVRAPATGREWRRCRECHRASDRKRTRSHGKP